MIQFKTVDGNPIVANGKAIVPRSRVLQIRFPWQTGGIIWNRPVSVFVQTTDGRDEVLPVHDVTRLAQLAVFGFALVLVLLIAPAMPRR